MDKTEEIKTVAKKIKGIHTATFSTIDEKGNIVSRPMATQEVEFDGTIWFMTSKESHKAQQIAAQPHVGISYSSDDKTKFISVSGTAELLRDEAKITEFWNDYYKAWFEGPEDPNITLLKVTVNRVEYWDMPGGKIGAAISIATSALTGKPEDNDEHEVFEFN
jgi:general stress protein 26